MDKSVGLPTPIDPPVPGLDSAKRLTPCLPREAGHPTTEANHRLAFPHLQRPAIHVIQSDHLLSLVKALCQLGRRVWP